jgi:succinate dehydrogenase/fumarate reductase cytochrome b subunit
MLKKLYGLFIYKLQYTSFFSIMQRVSGFLLLFVLYYFFLQEIFLNFFFYNEFFIKILSYFFFILLFIFLFYFCFHFVNGLRIYFTSLYYDYNLNKKYLNLNLLYSLKLIEKNNFFKLIINILIKINEFIKIIIIKSNTFFLLIIIIFFIISIFIFLL